MFPFHICKDAFSLQLYNYPLYGYTLFNKFHYWWALGLFPFFCYFNIVALCILEHKAFCICASIFGLILRSRIFRLPYIKIALIYASINIVWEWQFSSPYTHQLSIKIFFYFLSICVFLQMTFHLLSSYESSSASFSMCKSHLHFLLWTSFMSFAQFSFRILIFFYL